MTNKEVYKGGMLNKINIDEGIIHRWIRIKKTTILKNFVFHKSNI